MLLIASEFDTLALHGLAHGVSVQCNRQRTGRNWGDSRIAALVQLPLASLQHHSGIELETS